MSALAHTGFCSANWRPSAWRPGFVRAAVLGLVGLGLAAMAGAFRLADLRAGEALRAALVLAVGTLPSGYLVTRRLGRGIWRRPIERFALALLCGWPLLAAGHYLLGVLGLEPALPAAVLLVASLAAAVAWRARGRGPDRERPSFGLVDAGLVAFIGLALLATSRDQRALRPTPLGLAYDHTLEHAVHVAMYWELLRGVPPAELPMAAGVQWPHYHVLGYLPGVSVVRYSGLGAITLYHGLMPLWHTALLALALHLAVIARSARAAASGAALLTLFFVANVLESAFTGEGFLGRVPLEFLTRMVSGGAGIVLWTTVAALLAASSSAAAGATPSADARRTLLLAACLAGLAYMVKAQMFLLLGGGFVLALAALCWRGQARAAGQALLVFALSLAPLALTWRTTSALGAVHLRPGQFARDAGLGARFADLGDGVLVLVGTPLALWTLLHFTPLFPSYGALSLWRARRAPLVDVFLGGALACALGLGASLALQEPQPGEVSALFVREGLYALQVAAVVADTLLAAALLARLSRGRLDGPRSVALLALGAALGLLPVLAATPTHRGSPDGVLLSKAEQGALAYLRQNAPADAVVAQTRTLALSRNDARGDPRTQLDRVPVVAAFAGRRSVLEYYRPDIDPSVNRQRLLRSLFSTEDRAKGEAILLRFAVDYVLEYPQLKLRFASPLLTQVYAQAGVRVLRCERGGRQRRPPLPAPAELR